MATARKITGMMERSSWIRKMFETGAALKAEHGADNVFDFSLGNLLLYALGKLLQGICGHRCLLLSKKIENRLGNPGVFRVRCTVRYHALSFSILGTS